MKIVPNISTLPMQHDNELEWMIETRRLAESQVLRAVLYSKAFAVVDGVLVLYGADPRWDLAIAPFNKKIPGFPRTLAAVIALKAERSLEEWLYHLGV